MVRKMRSSGRSEISEREEGIARALTFIRKMQQSMPRHHMGATSPGWVNAIRRYVLVVTLGAEKVRRTVGETRRIEGVGWTHTDRPFHRGRGGVSGADRCRSPATYKIHGLLDDKDASNIARETWEWRRLLW
jgi:hypothetical protein